MKICATSFSNDVCLAPLGAMPKAILERMREEGMVVKDTQVAYQIKLYNKDHLASRAFTLRDVVDWANKHFDFDRPSDEDAAFVTKLDYATEPERECRLFISTRRLISYTRFVSSA